MSNEMLEAALAYEACGLSLLSWSYRERNGKFDKVPTHKWKVGEVPRLSAFAIRERWTERPDANIGVITGRPSQLIILDADDEASAQEIERIAPTPWRITTGRGMHFGYRYPELKEGDRIQNGTHLGCKFKGLDVADPKHRECGPLCRLDIRADGGYAAMPPSVHKSGRIYEWDTDLDDLGDIIRQMPVFNMLLIPGVSACKDANYSDEVDWASADFGGDVRAAEVWLAGQPAAETGNGGRSVTFRIAATLVRDFGLAPRQALDLMLTWNRRCVPPWTEQELVGKIEDAYKKGTSPIASRGGTSIDKALALLPARKVIQREEEVPGAQQPVAPMLPTGNPAPIPTKPRVNPLDVLVNPLKGLTDEEFALKLPVEVAKDPGLLFDDYVLATACRIDKDNKSLYYRILADLKTIKAPVADWKRHLRNLARAGGAKAVNDKLINEKRIEINIGDDQRDIRDAILDALKQCPGIYVSSGKLGYVRKGSISEMHGGALQNFIADNCRVVSKQSVAELGTIDKSATVPSAVVQMLEDLLYEQTLGFRELKAVANSPFFTPSGELICSPGYDAETQTMLYETPMVDPSIFSSPKDALEFLWGIFGDFPFSGQAEWANYVGAMLTPMMRTMYDGATMWVVMEGNNRGIGKTWLGNFLQVIHGIKPSTPSLPFKEEEIVKEMLGYLQKGQLVLLFDNVKHVIDSACLEALGTSTGTWEARGLGSNRIVEVQVRALFVLCANNMTTSIDVARRLLRVRLTRPAGVRPTYNIPDIQTFVRENRGAILSALAHIVLAWLKAGRPVPESAAKVIRQIGGGYEEFGRHIGACLHWAGLPMWGTNFEEAKKTWSINEEWGPFLHTWHDELNKNGIPTEQTAKALLELAIKHGLMSGALSRASDTASKLAVFQRKLNDLRDYDDGMFRVEIVDKGNGRLAYRNTKYAD